VAIEITMIAAKVNHSSNPEWLNTVARVICVFFELVVIVFGLLPLMSAQESTMQTVDGDDDVTL